MEYISRKEIKEFLTNLTRMRVKGMEWNDGKYEIGPDSMERVALLADATLKLLEAKSGEEANWPYNLLEEMFNGWCFDTDSGTWKEPPETEILTPDQQAGLSFAISTLTDREQKCLLLYYRDGWDLVRIGKEFGVTRERIRQVIAKAVRKLRYPTRSKYVIKGYHVASGNIFRNQMEQYRMEIDRAKHNADETIRNFRRVVKEPETAISEAVGNTDIAELNLSVRAYNVLKRAGCRTIADVLMLPSVKHLTRLRNMGRKSAEEVIETLRERGYLRLANGEELKLP